MNILGYFFEQFQIFSRKICKIVFEYNRKYSQLISSSDNKKILLTTRNVRLDSGHYATKYYCKTIRENMWWADQKFDLHQSDKLQGKFNSETFITQKHSTTFYCYGNFLTYKHLTKKIRCHNSRLIRFVQKVVKTG